METKWNGRAAMRNQMFHYVLFPTTFVPISAFIAALSAEDKRKETLETYPSSQKEVHFRTTAQISTVCVKRKNIQMPEDENPLSSANSILNCTQCKFKPRPRILHMNSGTVMLLVLSNVVIRQCIVVRGFALN